MFKVLYRCDLQFERQSYELQASLDARYVAILSSLILGSICLPSLRGTVLLQYVHPETSGAEEANARLLSSSAGRECRR